MDCSTPTIPFCEFQAVSALETICQHQDIQTISLVNDIPVFLRADDEFFFCVNQMLIVKVPRQTAYRLFEAARFVKHSRDF
jgi:hypothetical protein